MSKEGGLLSHNEVRRNKLAKGLAISLTGPGIPISHPAYHEAHYDLRRNTAISRSQALLSSLYTTLQQ